MANADELQTFSSTTHGLASDNRKTVAVKVADLNLEKEISNLDFSPDGSHLAAVEWTGSEVLIWKWASESEISKRLAFSEGSALPTTQSTLKYSPDGTLLAMAQMAQRTNDFGVVRIWDTRSGLVVHEIKEASRNGLRSSIAFSGDGKFLMRSYDAVGSSSGDQFFVHDTNTWNVLWSLSTLPFVPQTLSLSPNGRWVALGGISRDGSGTLSEVIILNVERREIARRLTAFAFDQAPYTLVWSADNSRILASTIDGSATPAAPSLIALDVSNGGKTVLESDAAAGIKSLVFASHGKYLIEAGEKFPVTIWDSAHTTILQEIPVQPARLAISIDGRFLAVASLSKLTVWRVD